MKENYQVCGLPGAGYCGLRILTADYTDFTDGMEKWSDGVME
jgi:hypothetical protein